LVVPSGGGETVSLNVHRGVLCKSSEFFQKAMKPEWADLGEDSKILHLPEDSTSTVSDYIKWLYYDKVAIKPYEAGTDTIKKKAEEAEKVFILLAEAYVFGEKIMDTEYKNAVVKALSDCKSRLHWRMGPESVSIVYNNTPPGSPLRRWIADRLAYSASDDSKNEVGWMQFIDGYPQEALVDAMKALLRVRTLKSGSMPNVQSYLE
jgi:hypothetical protein